MQALGGAAALAQLEFSSAPSLPVPAFDPAASGVVKLNGQILGLFGMITDGVAREYDLATPVAAAELNLDALIALFPPRSLVHTLPQFPSIERDLSLIVGENTAWSAIDSLVRSSRQAGKLPHMEEHWFVTTYRGQPVPQGKKSVTFRMRFRDPADQRTLRHEEVDPQVAILIDRAKAELAAELRA